MSDKKAGQLFKKIRSYLHFVISEDHLNYNILSYKYYNIEESNNSQSGAMATRVTPNHKTRGSNPRFGISFYCFAITCVSLHTTTAVACSRVTFSTLLVTTTTAPNIAMISIYPTNF